MVNASKSTFYVGGIPHARVLQIALFLGFSICILPYSYLGAPIFKGKSKAIYFQAIGIRSLRTLNEAFNLTILKSRVIRGQKCISHHIFSSLWCGFKNEFNVIWDNTSFNLGNGRDIMF
jgi:hypothetical protein